MAFLAQQEIKDRILLGELIEAPKGPSGVVSFDSIKLNQSSVDLHLGKEIYKVGCTAPEILTKSAPYATLTPGQFAILTTDEVISIPNDILAFISLKSSFKFQGLVNISGFHVDPTFKGKLRFGVQNVGPSDIRIKYGEPTFSIFYSTLSSTNIGGPRNDSSTGIRLQDVQLLGGGSLSLASLHKQVDKLSTLVKIYGGLAIAALAALIVDLMQKAH